MYVQIRLESVGTSLFLGPSLSIRSFQCSSTVFLCDVGLSSSRLATIARRTKSTSRSYSTTPQSGEHSGSSGDVMLVSELLNYSYFYLISI